MSEWVALKNDLGLTIRPIDVWPGKLRAAWQREKGPYSAPIKDTLQTLRRELNALRATNIILQIAIREGDLRLDGLPRAQAIAEHPGVILCFDTPKGSRRRAFDRFSKWQYNLRALALNLEHLRLANLYGVEGDEAQYTGWKALPAAPATAPTGFESVDVDRRSGACARCDAAARFLASVSGRRASDILGSREVLQEAYRAASQALHPDAGGSHEQFVLLQQAMALLKERFGL